MSSSTVRPEPHVGAVAAFLAAPLCRCAFGAGLSQHQTCSMATETDLPSILIVEDDPFDVLLLTNSLAAMGVDRPIAVCADGREAIAWFGKWGASDSVDSKTAPCLMVVELRLPQLDGISLISWVRDQRSLAKMTIVAVSASLEPEAAKRTFAAGADHFLGKPIDAPTLRQVLEDVGVLEGSGERSTDQG